MECFTLPSRPVTTLVAKFAVVFTLAAFASVAIAQNAPAPAGLSAVAGNAASTFTKSEADKAWEETVKAVQPPAQPKEWSEKQPTEAQVSAYFTPYIEKAVDKARDFYTRFPDRPEAEQARQVELKLLTTAVRQFHDTNLSERLLVVQKSRASDPGSSDDEKFLARAQPLADMVSKLPVGLDEYVKGVRALQKDFPQRPDVYELALLGLSETDAETTRSWVKEIMDGPAPEEVKSQLGLLGKPVSIQYTAIDGRRVDLGKLKGKVVLVDFWATWCGPCVAELPNVKAAYEKLHSKGFEIVGISFDEKQDALTSFIAKEKTPWPQYFDGKGWGNDFGVKFGIHSIPAMWLIDKQGNLRNLNAREALADKVAKLLAE